MQAEPAGEVDGVIHARIIGEDDVVDDVARNLRDRLLQRASGVVGREHHADPLSEQHPVQSSVILRSGVTVAAQLV